MFILCIRVFANTVATENIEKVSLLFVKKSIVHIYGLEKEMDSLKESRNVCVSYMME